MPSSTYYLSSNLYNYLIGRKKNHVPKVILNDPLVQYVRREIMNNECPFCWRKYKDRSHVVHHLKSRSICAKLFSEFMDLTIDRYLLFYNNSTFHRKLRKLGIIEE